MVEIFLSDLMFIIGDVKALTLNFFDNEALEMLIDRSAHLGLLLLAFVLYIGALETFRNRIVFFFINLPLSWTYFDFLFEIGDILRVFLNASEHGRERLRQHRLVAHANVAARLVPLDVSCALFFPEAILFYHDAIVFGPGYMGLGFPCLSFTFH